MHDEKADGRQPQISQLEKRYLNTGTRTLPAVGILLFPLGSTFPHSDDLNLVNLLANCFAVYWRVENILPSEQLRFWLESIVSIAGMIVFSTIDLELLRAARTD